METLCDQIANTPLAALKQGNGDHKVERHMNRYDDTVWKELHPQNFEKESLMSTPQTSPNTQPTKRAYLDDEEIRMSFNWIKTMPHGGYLGEVSYGSFQKKPIQVFAAVVNPDGSKTWQYQAQDGSFLCSMKVTSDQSSITFSDLKKGTWPLITVYARFP